MNARMEAMVATAIRRSARGVLPALVVASMVVGCARGQPGPLAAQWQTLATIFIGAFIEAAPFLLAGSLVSGAIRVFVNQETLHRWVPRSPLLATLAGALLGLLFAVCEHGVAPVVRRLYQKGLPVSVGIVLLMAAPVVKLVVILSTLAALGWSPLCSSLAWLTLAVAVAIGLLFMLARPEEVFAPGIGHATGCCHDAPAPGRGIDARLRAVLLAGGDEFLRRVRR